MHILLINKYTDDMHTKIECILAINSLWMGLILVHTHWFKKQQKKNVHFTKRGLIKVLHFRKPRVLLA